LSASLLSETAKKNIELMAQAEERLHLNQTFWDRLGDRVARYFGSLWFIGAHAVIIGAWFVLNTEVIDGIEPFDPYPFAFLGLVIGIEFIALTSFVLMNQSVQTKRLEKWGHVTLQVSILTEQEVTKSLQLLSQICERLDIHHAAADWQSRELAQPTQLASLIDEIEKAHVDK
jgi:uncharacterized membrane protein